MCPGIPPIKISDMLSYCFSDTTESPFDKHDLAVLAVDPLRVEYVLHTRSPGYQVDCLLALQLKLHLPEYPELIEFLVLLKHILQKVGLPLYLLHLLLLPLQLVRLILQLFSIFLLLKRSLPNSASKPLSLDPRGRTVNLGSDPAVGQLP
jgi:hypothetical protein